MVAKASQYDWRANSAIVRIEHAIRGWALSVVLPSGTSGVDSPDESHRGAGYSSLQAASNAFAQAWRRRDPVNWRH